MEQMFFLCSCSDISINGQAYEEVIESWPEITFARVDMLGRIIDPNPRRGFAKPHTRELYRLGFVSYTDNDTIRVGLQTEITFFAGQRKFVLTDTAVHSHIEIQQIEDEEFDDMETTYENESVELMLDIDFGRLSQIDMSIFSKSPELLDFIIDEFEGKVIDDQENPVATLEDFDRMFNGNIDWASNDVLAKMGTPGEIRRFKRKRGMSGMFGRG